MPFKSGLHEQYRLRYLQEKWGRLLAAVWPNRTFSERELSHLAWQYMDLLYPYEVRYPIPLLMVEGPYEHGPVKLREDDVVIDAGANVGLFAYWASRRLSPKGRVYAFEPVPEVYACLRQLVAHFSLEEKVSYFPLALGGTRGDLRLELAPLGGAAGVIKRNIVGQAGLAITVAQTTIDEFVAGHNLPFVSFIKMDIEGMEREALKGATRTLATWKPRLALCTYHLPDDPEVLRRLILEAAPAYQITQTRAKLYAWHPAESACLSPPLGEALSATLG
jgi:FkbM family methyltransferase